MPQTYDDTAQVIGPRDFKAIPRPDRGEGEVGPSLGAHPSFTLRTRVRTVGRRQLRVCQRG